MSVSDAREPDSMSTSVGLTGSWSVDGTLGETIRRGCLWGINSGSASSSLSSARTVKPPVVTTPSTRTTAPPLADAHHRLVTSTTGKTTPTITFKIVQKCGITMIRNRFVVHVAALKSAMDRAPMPRRENWSHPPTEWHVLVESSPQQCALHELLMPLTGTLNELRGARVAPRRCPQLWTSETVRLWEPHSEWQEGRKGLVSATDFGGPGLLASPTRLPWCPYFDADRADRPITESSRFRLQMNSLALGQIAPPWEVGVVANSSLLGPPNSTTWPPLPHCLSRSPLGCPSADPTSTR